MAALHGLTLALALLMAACDGGSRSTVAALAVTAARVPPPAFSYNGSSPFPAVVGQSIALRPAVIGTVERYAVSPALPPGLQLDRVNGAICGTPTQASGPATFVVTATAAGAHSVFPLVISVTEPPSALVYDSPLHATLGVALRPVSPKVTGSVDQYSIVPSLPGGLVLDGTTGVISGTPREATMLMTYTITAGSFAGRTEFKLKLVVRPARAAEVVRCAERPECS
jgi:large repetitive protein